MPVSLYNPWEVTGYFQNLYKKGRQKGVSKNMVSLFSAKLIQHPDKLGLQEKEPTQQPTPMGKYKVLGRALQVLETTLVFCPGLPFLMSVVKSIGNKLYILVWLLQVKEWKPQGRGNGCLRTSLRTGEQRLRHFRLTGPSCSSDPKSCNPLSRPGPYSITRSP